MTPISHLFFLKLKPFRCLLNAPKLALSILVFAILIQAGLLNSQVFAQSDETSNSQEFDDSDLPGSESCVVELSKADDRVTIDYDPFQAGAAGKEINFILNNPSSVACQLVLQVSERDSLPSFDYEFASTGVTFELRSSENQTDLVRSRADGAFDISLEPSVSREYTLNAVITEDAVAAASDHLLEMEFKVLDLGSSANTLVTWQSDLILESLPRAQVNLSGTTGAYGKVGSMSSVDFGIAKKNAERLVYVQLRANTPANLSVFSENHGALIHTEKGSEAPTIKYSVALGDEDLDLNKTYNKTFDLPKTYEGESFPMTIRLGDPKGAMAGRYSDTLIFEFSPL